MTANSDKPRYRLCCVCGLRHGPTYNFRNTLQIVEAKKVVPSSWLAVPSCVSRLKAKHVSKLKRRGERISHPLTTYIEERSPDV